MKLEFKCSIAVSQGMMYNIYKAKIIKITSVLQLLEGLLLSPKMSVPEKMEKLLESTMIASTKHNMPRDIQPICKCMPIELSTFPTQSLSSKLVDCLEMVLLRTIHFKNYQKVQSSLSLELAIWLI
jgi:hypothetical protein